MDNDFFAEADFYKSHPNTRLVWIFLMCQASKKMSQSFKVNLAMISDQTILGKNEVLEAVDALLKIGCLESKEPIIKSTRSNPIVSQKFPSATNERTDERTDNTVPVAPVSVTADPELSGDALSEIKPSAAIDLLNQVCGRQFKNNSKANLTVARARLREGYTLSDMRKVFEFKNHEWAGDPKMAQFLQPSTLLGNKFEGYLQAAMSGVSSVTDKDVQNLLDSMIPEDMRPKPRSAQ